MTAPALTQRALVLAIVRSIEERGYPPTIGELATEYGVSKPVVHRRLRRLARDGHVEIDANVARGIRIVSVPNE